MPRSYGVIEAKAGGGASPAGAGAVPPCPALPRERSQAATHADTVPASAAGERIQCPARLTPRLSNLFCHLSLPNVSLFCLSHLVCHSFDSLHN